MFELPFGLIFFVSATTVLFFTDLRYRRLPNFITIALLIVGLIHSYYYGTILNSLLAAIIMFALFMIFALKGYMGGGDVKMASALGAWLGYPGAVIVICVACVLGAVTTLIIATAKGQLGGHLKQAVVHLSLFRTAAPIVADADEIPLNMTIPFGSYMGLCSLVYLFYLIG